MREGEQTRAVSSIITKDDGLHKVHFSLSHNAERGVSFLNFTKSYTRTSVTFVGVYRLEENFPGKDLKHCCVIPKVDDKEAYFGIFDSGELFAVLYAKEGSEELEVRDSSNNIVNNASERLKYVKRICDLLEMKEYSLRLLKKKGNDLIYDPDSDWEKNLRSMPIYKNKYGTVCAYQNFNYEILDRIEWAKEIYDELESDIYFRDDLHADNGTTILSFMNTALMFNSKNPFQRLWLHLEIALIKDKDAIVLESPSGLQYLLSKGEGGKIKVNSLYMGDKNSKQKLFDSYMSFMGSCRECSFRAARLEDDKVVIKGLPCNFYLRSEMPKNEKLEEFSSQFTRFLKKHYFTYEEKEITNRLATVISSCKPLPENEKLLEMLNKSKILIVEKRTWFEFFTDLFKEMKAWCFEGKSYGNVMGGRISISYSNEDAEKLAKLMKTNPTPDLRASLSK